MFSRSVTRSRVWSINDCTFGTRASILEVISKSLLNRHVSIRDMDQRIYLATQHTVALMIFVNPTRTRSCSEFERCSGKAAIADDGCCCSGGWNYRSGVRKRVIR